MKRNQLARAIRIQEDDRHTSALEHHQSIDPFLDIAQRQQLIIEHNEVAHRLAWRMLNSWRVRIPQDEVSSTVGAALCEAAWRFDPERNVSFKTFLFYHLRGLLIKEIVKLLDAQRFVTFIPELGSTIEDVVAPSHVLPEEFHSEHPHPERLLEMKQIAELCWNACARLDPLEQEIIVRTFVYDQSLVQVAKELGYCRCHVSRVKSRALRLLSKTLKDSSLAPEQALRLDGKKADREILKFSEKSSKGYTGGRGRRKKEAIHKGKSGAEVLLRKVAG